MTHVRPDPDTLPLIARAKFGAVRGAVVGAVISPLVWLRLTKGQADMTMVRVSPIIFGCAFIVAFAIAGAALLAGKRHVRTTAGAIGLATACSIPLWLAVVPVITGELGLQTLMFVGLVSLLSGVIWGFLSWKGGF